jgi:hypothetical protein
MTPAGLGFFQSQWDESVTNTFHNTLGKQLWKRDVAAPGMLALFFLVCVHGERRILQRKKLLKLTPGGMSPFQLVFT